MGRAQVGLPGTPYSISDVKLAGAKRERRSWDACDAAVRRFAFPPQKYLFPEGEAENTLIDVPYTLVRPGPCVECHRVGGCDATGQGCRTKALLPYRATCHGLAAEIDNTRS